MEPQKKETYTEPVLVAHERLRDLTGQTKYKEKTSDKVTDNPD